MEHAQRQKQLFAHPPAKPDPGCRFHHCAQHIQTQTVPKMRTGLKLQRLFRECGSDVNGVCRSILLLQKLLYRGRAEIIIKAALHGQQMLDQKRIRYRV